MKFIRYLFHMIPILGSIIKDLFLKRLPREETKINYLFGKANAYEQANLLESSIQVYRGILKNDPKSISVFMNLGGLYFRRGMIEKAIPYYLKAISAEPDGGIIHGGILDRAVHEKRREERVKH